MGRNSADLTAKEAGEILGIGCGQVRGLIRQGILQAKTGVFGQNAMVSAEEVHALAEIRKEGITRTVPQLYRQMLIERVRLRGVERRLACVEGRLGLNARTLSYDKEDVLQLVENARLALNPLPTEALEVMDWANTFFGVQEELFELIERYTRSPEPWAPFLTLAEAIYTNRRLVLNEPDLEDAYAVLCGARQALRHTTYIYIMRKQGMKAATAVIHEADGNLLRRLNHHVP